MEYQRIAEQKEQRIANAAEYVEIWGEDLRDYLFKAPVFASQSALVRAAAHVKRTNIVSFEHVGAHSRYAAYEIEMRCGRLRAYTVSVDRLDCFEVRADEMQVKSTLFCSKVDCGTVKAASVSCREFLANVARVQNLDCDGSVYCDVLTAENLQARSVVCDRLSVRNLNCAHVTARLLETEIGGRAVALTDVVDRDFSKTAQPQIR